MDRAYRASTRVIGALTFVLGLVMIAVTVASGGGPLAIGVLGGALFAFLGAVRFAAAGRGQ